MPWKVCDVDVLYGWIKLHRVCWSIIIVIRGVNIIAKLMSHTQLRISRPVCHINELILCILYESVYCSIRAQKFQSLPWTCSIARRIGSFLIYVLLNIVWTIFFLLNTIGIWFETTDRAWRTTNIMLTTHKKSIYFLNLHTIFLSEILSMIRLHKHISSPLDHCSCNSYSSSKAIKIPTRITSPYTQQHAR